MTQTQATPDSSDEWLGKRLGLPADGPGSRAPLGRRFAALLIDWMLCQVIAIGVFHLAWGRGGVASLVPLGVFALENLVLISTAGATVGQALLKLRVGSVTRPTMSPLQVLIRTVSLCLLIPAVVTDSDGRGLHDRLADTVIIRR